jgi:hypothetical protein
MEGHFVCPVCQTEHAEAAEAVLGHLVICLDCALARDWSNALQEPVGDESLAA